MSISAEVDERTLREIHLVAFEAAVREAGVWALMTAYNKVHGIYCGEQPELLNGILRGEWGFDGVTMSDWYGTHSTAPAALAGLDLEMPGPPSWLGPNLAAAVRQGAVGEEVVDEQVRHLLGLMDRVGLLGTSDLRSSDGARRRRSRPAGAGTPGGSRRNGPAAQRRAAPPRPGLRRPGRGDRTERGADGHGRRELGGHAVSKAKPDRRAGRATASGDGDLRGRLSHRPRCSANRPSLAHSNRRRDRGLHCRVLRPARAAGGRLGNSGQRWHRRTHPVRCGSGRLWGWKRASGRCV